MGKILIILLLIFTSCVSQATNYFIKTGGNDAASGLSDANAWETITKINTEWAAGTFIAGDSILFNRGDTFYGTLIAGESGTIIDPITITAYGIGGDPIITGFTTVPAWVNEGGGIYSYTVSLESEDSVIVSVDGANTAIGRFPNTGWMDIDSHVGLVSLTDADLNSAITDWSGADVVIRVTDFMADRLVISTHVGSTLTFPPAAGSLYLGYFIQNNIQALDTLGEWYYDGAKFYMYFGGVDPTTKTVKVSSLTNGIEIDGYDYITVDNLTFDGFGGDGFNLINSESITIHNCTISFIGQVGIKGDTIALGDSPNILIDNNIITEVNDNGICLTHQFYNSTVTNNILTNIGLKVGSSFFHGPHWRAYIGILLFYADPATFYRQATNNTYSIVEYNSVDSTGYTGIKFNGRNVTVRRNFVKNYCMTLTDGGGIYCYTDYNDDITVENHITKNIVFDGRGNLTPLYYYGSGANGIYVDGYSIGVTVDSNTVIKTDGTNLFTNGNRFGVYRDNTIFDSWNYLVYFAKFSSVAPDIHENIVFKHNISCNKNPGGFNLLFTGGTELTPTAVFDSNFYANPVNGYAYFYYWNYAGGIQYYMQIMQWWQIFLRDLNSHQSIVQITTDSTAIDIYYNPTKVDSTLILAEDMYDLYGNTHTGSVLIKPFESIILIKKSEAIIIEEPYWDRNEKVIFFNNKILFKYNLPVVKHRI